MTPDQEKERRKAWDRYASGKASQIDQPSFEKDADCCAFFADAMLAERDKRFPLN
jgi:hypothetical protein